MILPRTKPKPYKPYQTTWQLTHAIFEKHAEIDANPRHAPLLQAELRKMEAELDARDR